MPQKFSWAVVVALFLGWRMIPPVRACSCLPPPPPAQAVARADAVFLGKVLAFEEIPAQYEKLARLEILSLWKGRPEEADSVYTSWSTASCGYNFQVGETYLVYAFRDGRHRLMTHLCSRTQLVAFAQADLNYLSTFSLFPLTVGNYWQFENDKTESIVDTLRLDGRLYFRSDKFREFNNALLRLSVDGKLYVRHDTLEQVWVDFNAEDSTSWHVKGPLNLGDEWEVQLASRADTIRAPAGTFFPCLRFHFRFAGADYDWDEWYLPNLGVVKRTLYGIAVFQFPLESAWVEGRSYPPSAIGEDPPSGPPRFFSLQQNYPNPFAAAQAHAATFIRYTLRQTAEVELTVFDLNGRGVKTLTKGRQSAGEYQIAWDGRDQRGTRVPGAIYFCRLRVDGSFVMKSMVVLP